MVDEMILRQTKVSEILFRDNCWISYMSGLELSQVSPRLGKGSSLRV
jgi:hypothetical protein